MKFNSRFFCCMLCSFVLAAGSVAQVYADLPEVVGDDNDIVNFEGKAQVYYDDVMPLSVNDDLTGATRLLPYYVSSSVLVPSRQYGNAVLGITSASAIDFNFNPYIVNNDGVFSDIDIEVVLTFENGYDADTLGVVSSTSGITGVKGFEVYWGIGNRGVLPTGFRYVDDNTVRISYSYKTSSSSFSSPPTLTLLGRDYLIGNSVKCDMYVIRKSSSVDVDGEGGGSGGSGSGGSGTAT